jgi:hypothetical protein
VSEPGFHFVCVPSALVGLPAEWVTDMLGDGKIALLVDGGGFAAIDEVAHTLGLISVPLPATRGNGGASGGHGDGVRRSPPARVGGRRPQRDGHRLGEQSPPDDVATGPLSEDERRRIDRFVAILGRQSE